MFNQTGAGVFCMKETGKANLEEGFKAAGYSGLDDERINGLMATVQVIQLGHSGSALYNVSEDLLSCGLTEGRRECGRGSGCDGRVEANG